MKISTKVECGIIALIDIALNSSEGNVVKVAAISQRHNISAKYLEQILPLLRQTQLIRSVKGASGGYVLSRPAEEMILRDIVDSLDNTILTNNSFDEKLDSSVTSAISQVLWDPVEVYMKQLSDSVTLKDLTRKYSELKGHSDEELMYYI